MARALTRSVYRHKWLGRESSSADLLSEHRVAVGWWLFSSKINQDLLQKTEDVARRKLIEHYTLDLVRLQLVQQAWPKYFAA